MRKHPSCYKLNEPLKSRNEQVKSEAVVLYEGRYLQGKTFFVAYLYWRKRHFTYFEAANTVNTLIFILIICQWCCYHPFTFLANSSCIFVVWHVKEKSKYSIHDFGILTVILLLTIYSIGHIQIICELSDMKSQWRMILAEINSVEFWK